ncbi:hypothetical protein [Methylobacterium sp. 10]|uniref:hypothetical protein n=1 Tax=Methylobacterium sp. 10 TaxID=1101191 RepID=UPI0012DFE66F|nr:hypothetical protein [Methylobacterium sp. 10]
MSAATPINRAAPTPGRSEDDVVMLDNRSVASEGREPDAGFPQEARLSWSERSYVEPASLGLAPGCKPVRKIARKSKRISRPGFFSSRKTWSRDAIRAESLFEQDGLAHIETNPRYVRIAPQPHRLTYHLDTGNDGVLVRTYVPDLAVLTIDRTVVIVDFKWSFLRRDPAWAKLEPVIREAYRRDHGATFRVLTEEHIHVEPRRTNVTIMMMHRPMVTDGPAITAVRVAIDMLGLPSTIGRLRSASGLIPQPPEDRAFSALMELAMAGEVEIDMSERFYDGSVVHRGIR